MWPQCGAATSQKPLRPPIPRETALCRGLRRGFRGPREKSQKLPLHRPFFVCQKVDKNTGRRLYTPSWTRRRSVRWRVCEAPHCSHGDRIRPFRHGHVRVAASDVRGLTPPGHGGRSCKVPGCLTSESEERETWTAESLRAASSNGEGFVFFRESAAMEETSAAAFQVNTVTIAMRKHRKTSEWDLVKRCDLPRSNLFNLRV